MTAPAPMTDPDPQSIDQSLWTVAVTYEDHAHTHTDHGVTDDELLDSIDEMLPTHPLGPITITITPEELS